MFKELDQDNLAQVVQDNGTVIVQFSAGWCGNCRIMKPKFKKLAGEMDDVAFVVADAEKFPLSRQMAKVDNLPTFAAFKDGKLVNQIQTNKFEVLNDLVNEVTHN